MHIERYTVPFFAENCYLVYSDHHAVIIDPGAGAADLLKPRLVQLELQVDAVLCTHGHADHIWDAAAFNAPCYISRPDLYRFESPIQSTSGGLLPLPGLQEKYGEWQRPEDLRVYPVQALESGMEFAPGIYVRAFAVPGHTEGQVILLLGGGVEAATQLADFLAEAEAEAKDISGIVFTGDHIFAGSVGRSDLPGGDDKNMLHSLRTTANAVNPASLLLPGHGNATILSTQLSTNPYVRQARKLG